MRFRGPQKGMSKYMIFWLGVGVFYSIISFFSKKSLEVYFSMKRNPQNTYALSQIGAKIDIVRMQLYFPRPNFHTFLKLAQVSAETTIVKISP